MVLAGFAAEACGWFFMALVGVGLSWRVCVCVWELCAVLRGLSCVHPARVDRSFRTEPHVLYHHLGTYLRLTIVGSACMYACCMESLQLFAALEAVVGRLLWV